MYWKLDCNEDYKDQLKQFKSRAIASILEQFYTDKILGYAVSRFFLNIIF